MKKKNAWFTEFFLFIPQPASPTMSVTRFSMTFSTIFFLKAITGSNEKLDCDNGEVYEALLEDEEDAILGIQKPSSLSLSLSLSTKRFVSYLCFSD